MQFQSYIQDKNHWDLEPDLPHLLSIYWEDFPQHINELGQFGALIGERAYALGDHIDHNAIPSLIMHDLDGKRVDRARLSPAHSALLKELAVINRPPYDGGSWLHHFALGYLLADPGLYCTLIVTNQTAYAIHKYAPEQKEWLEPLLRGDAWGATWMTETHGGSDLGANLTLARQEEGVWRLYGDHKYFASNAGIADIALATARPEGAPPGPKGLALFLVPRLNGTGELNYHVLRFKDKSATRAVPTGEVEFRGSQAYLVGQAELGVYYTLENLTVSRLANAVGAMGLSRKAHLEALLRTQSRQAFAHTLAEHPLIRYDLTDLAVRTAAGLALIFHAVHAFDRAWRSNPPYTPEYHYARFLSHLAKNRTAEHAAQVTLLAIEIFGGLGFLEEYAPYRLHREALVTLIWEGTSNIQALELLEAMGKKSAHESFLDDILPRLERASGSEFTRARRTLESTLSHITILTPNEAQWHSKDALRTLADIAQVALLLSLAEHGGERYAKLASLYATRFIASDSYPTWALKDSDVWFPLRG
ncbi:MAG: acyl-CoA dehydrogenase family protein [Chloroflexota bacterium]